jgi:hypothetical protein
MSLHSMSMVLLAIAACKPSVLPMGHRLPSVTSVIDPLMFCLYQQSGSDKDSSGLRGPGFESLLDSIHPEVDFCQVF